VDIDVQVLAASNRNLSQRVQEGAFRRDLYHRITVFTLELPPLRARKEDLRDLVPLFVAEYNLKAGRSVRVIPEAVWSALFAHDWPGNVRELRNTVERCVLLSDSATLAGQWLQLEPAAGAELGPAPVPSHAALILPLDGTVTLDEMERRIVSAALERADYNVTAAARLLGTSRETLRYRVGKFGLKSRD
jgi:transcriptional regulator with GAF, ATPase, and Fis domain